MKRMGVWVLFGVLVNTAMAEDRLTQVRQEARVACEYMERAQIGMERHWLEIQEYFGSQGINFPVLYANRNFYLSRVRRRVSACRANNISLRLAGRCNSERQTRAFVRVTLGFVHSTINICDEYFRGTLEARVDTLVHEYGRLEGIGDSPNFDTDNIYVWDATIGRLGGAEILRELRRLTPTPAHNAAPN